MPVVLPSYTLRGLDAVPVDVEVQSSSGMPYFGIIGMAGKSILEAKDRVRGAIQNSGFTFPMNRKVVNLAPAEEWKRGSHFDLAMAVGILMVSEQMPPVPMDVLLIGELGLEGGVKSVRGILPGVLHAKEQGFRQVVVPEANVKEAALLEGIEVIPVRSLREAVKHFEGEGRAPAARAEWTQETEATWDMTDISGHAAAKRALLVAAVGGHHVFMQGPPGTGKSILARSFASILPELNMEEKLDVHRIHSVAGQALQHNAGRPVRHVHHHCTPLQLVGGGNTLQPGEISLAHHGVLFLDEILEFPRKHLERLREPLESHEVHFRYGKRSTRYPCNFQLVAAANPCPCGYFGDTQHHCQCAAHQVQRYQNRLSGPLRDRIDIQIHVPRLPYDQLSQNGESSLAMRQQVEAARAWQKKRGQVVANHQLEFKALRFQKFSADCVRFLERLTEEHALSGRRLHHLLAVARSIADLGQRKQIRVEDLVEARHYSCI